MAFRRALPVSAPGQGGATPRVITVGGGKGGVGKTLLTASLSVVLARLGSQVCAVDADLEGANLHTILGVAAPRLSLADYVAQRERDLRRLQVDTAIPGLRLIAATGAPPDDAQPASWNRIELLEQIRKLPADCVLVDLGAGAHPAVLDYFLVGDLALLVFTPEPTSIENAYSFLKAAFYRRLRLAVTNPATRDIVSQAMDQKNERGIRTPHDLLRAVRAISPEEGNSLIAAMRSFHPQIVVNGVKTAQDVRLGFNVRSVCAKYFGLEADYLGYVNWDDAVGDAVRARTPVVEKLPDSDAAIYLTRIARKILTRLDPAKRPSLYRAGDTGYSAS